MFFFMFFLLGAIFVQLLTLLLLIAFAQRLVVILNQLLVPVSATRHEDVVSVNLGFLHLPVTIEFLVHLALTKDVVALNIQILAVLCQRAIDDLGCSGRRGASRLLWRARHSLILRESCACRQNPGHYDCRSHGSSTHRTLLECRRVDCSRCYSPVSPGDSGPSFRILGSHFS